MIIGRHDFLTNNKVTNKPIIEDVFNKEQVKKKRAIETEIAPRILLVEDNEMNRKIIITMLQKQNMTCDIAKDGYEAYIAVKSNDYDIVFMDCQMPIMDGCESALKIREYEGDKKHTRIVAMTANAMTGDRTKCFEAGMDDYISKSINFKRMFKLIEESTNNN